MPKIKLKTALFDYLVKSNFLSNELLEALKNSAESSTRNTIVNITVEEADLIRDAAGVQLQRVGLGPDSEPNADGKFLEDIVDALYIP